MIKLMDVGSYYADTVLMCVHAQIARSVELQHIMRLRKLHAHK